MRPVHLRSVDLNLLPVLDALLLHRNATRAGKDIGLTQPAMSRALGRLRFLLDDPLLVRSVAGYTLTPRAEALREPLRALLAEVHDLLVEPAFDPAKEERTFTLAMADSQACLLLPSLIARLAREAPQVRIRSVTVDRNSTDKLLRGEIDLAIALDTTPLPPGMMTEPLGEDELALVRRVGHPTNRRRWSLADYAAWPSVAIALVGDGASDLDAELARHGIQRTIAAVVPSFAAALAIVAGSDCITTVSKKFAERFAHPGFLDVSEPPLETTRLGLVSVWSEIRQKDRLLEWLRSLMRELLNG